MGITADNSTDYSPRWVLRPGEVTVLFSLDVAAVLELTIPRMHSPGTMLPVLVVFASGFPACDWLIPLVPGNGPPDGGRPPFRALDAADLDAAQIVEELTSADVRGETVFVSCSIGPRSAWRSITECEAIIRAITPLAKTRGLIVVVQMADAADLLEGTRETRQPAVEAFARALLDLGLPQLVWIRDVSRTGDGISARQYVMRRNA